ncbi:MAG: hypothetical protein AAF192_23670 [Pseudomonadota bacterium]
MARPLAHPDLALHASADDVARQGRPAHDGDLAGHRFVGLMATRPPASAEIRRAAAVPPQQVVHRGPDMRAGRAAAPGGLGIAPLVTLRPEPGPQAPPPPREDRRTPLRRVAHRDRRRTPKLRAVCEGIEAMFGHAGP